MMTHFRKDGYIKGVHLASSPTGHDAFRQSAAAPFRRSRNNLQYEASDPYDEGIVWDNLHCAHCQSVDSESYGSAGCQVIVGSAKKRGAQYAGSVDTGPWGRFKRAAYALDQKSFDYVLFSVQDVKRTVLGGAGKPFRVRFGSNGPRAKKVQQALIGKGFLTGTADGAFGPKSHDALMRYQEKAFGPLADDGICGPQTAEALGIDW